MNGIDETSETDDHGSAEQLTEEPLVTNWLSEEMPLGTPITECVTDDLQTLGNVLSASEVEIHTINCHHPQPLITARGSDLLGPSSNEDIAEILMDSREVQTAEVEGQHVTRNVQTDVFFSDQNLEVVVTSSGVVVSDVDEISSSFVNVKEQKNDSNCKDAICYDGETDKEAPTTHSSR